MRQYLDLMEEVFRDGVEKKDRTGVGTLSIFGRQMRFDLSRGFPLITTKKLHLKSIIYELLWFLSGQTNIASLQENGVRIWNQWADENGELGPIYGKQWRSWEGKGGKVVDQISWVVDEIKNNPDSRRLIVNAWNVGELEEMALCPCHCFFQFYVGGGKLSCHLYQRSADVFLGLPFNIASYSLLTSMVAAICGLIPGELVHSIGDAHLYKNHLEQVQIQLKRTPYQWSSLELNPHIKNLFDYRYEDVVVHNYRAHDHIKAEVAV